MLKGEEGNIHSSAWKNAVSSVGNSAFPFMLSVSPRHVLRHYIQIPAQLLSRVSDFCDAMDCSPPGSSVHGIFQARILKQVTIPSSNIQIHF